MYRYVVNIYFKQSMFQRVENVAEPFKTLKEAQGCKSLIDDTVLKDCIVDKITGKVVDWWVS